MNIPIQGSTFGLPQDRLQPIPWGGPEVGTLYPRHSRHLWHSPSDSWSTRLRGIRHAIQRHVPRLKGGTWQLPKTAAPGKMNLQLGMGQKENMVTFGYVMLQTGFLSEGSGLGRWKLPTPPHPTACLPQKQCPVRSFTKGQPPGALDSIVRPKGKTKSFGNLCWDCAPVYFNILALQQVFGQVAHPPPHPPRAIDQR